MLATITLLALRSRKTRPYFITGWFWYLGLLVPVLGIALMVARGAADLRTRLRYRTQLLTVGADCPARALRVRRLEANFALAEQRDALELCGAGDSGERRRAQHLGEVLFKRGQIDDALAHYETALQLRAAHPASGYDLLLAIIHSNIGSALASKDRFDQAIEHYRSAMQAQPDYGSAYVNLGRALIVKRETDSAIPVLQKAIALDPENAEAEIVLGDALLQSGRQMEAIAHYEKALAALPDSIVALNNLAWLFATSGDSAMRNGARAVELAARAVQLSGGKNPFFLQKLAVAQAANGSFPAAIVTAERALELATKQSNRALIGELRRNLALYRTDTPLRR